MQGRYFEVSSIQLATDGEKAITVLLNDKLKPSFVEVRDISGERLTTQLLYMYYDVIHA